MARTKSVKVEEKTAEVVEQKEPETETKAEVDNSSAEEAIAPEINSVDGENCESGENGEVIGAQCVEGGEPEIILGQTKPEDLPTDGAVDENVDAELDKNEAEANEEEKEEKEEEEEKPEETEEPQVNLTAGVASTVVNDPICGNRAVFQPQVSINNYQSTDAVARGENARRGEIIKRC